MRKPTSRNNVPPLSPTVELRELRIFLVLAEELHFARTAERVLISQSRVSQVVRRLEMRVGGALFERTSRRVELTRLGEQLRDGVAPAYRQLEQAFQAAYATAAGITGTLRIGTYATENHGPHMLDIISAVHARHPGCAVSIINTGLHRNYLDVLREGEIDMAIVRLPLSDADIAVGPVLSRENRIVLIATSDPLAQRDSLTLEDLARDEAEEP